jgi:hypothetical protein
MAASIHNFLGQGEMPPEERTDSAPCCRVKQVIKHRYRNHLGKGGGYGQDLKDQYGARW